ncbi:MAG: hypothetical protein RR782_02565 [Clostridium sp.]
MSLKLIKFIKNERFGIVTIFQGEKKVGDISIEQLKDFINDPVKDISKFANITE